MRQVVLPDGTHVPALGQGTWNMAERADARPEEIAALREGVERGLTLIDTAEMYANGRSEELVGEAIEGLRDRVFLVTKAYPHAIGSFVALVQGANGVDSQACIASRYRQDCKTI